MTWNVDHMRKPEDGKCPVCGQPFDYAEERYSEPEISLEASGRNVRWCVTAGVASRSPDPMLIVIQHG